VIATVTVLLVAPVGLSTVMAPAPVIATEPIVGVTLPALSAAVIVRAPVLALVTSPRVVTPVSEPSTVRVLVPRITLSPAPGVATMPVPDAVPHVLAPVKVRSADIAVPLAIAVKARTDIPPRRAFLNVVLELIFFIS
jgi:hypothetical protein